MNPKWAMFVVSVVALVGADFFGGWRAVTVVACGSGMILGLTTWRSFLYLGLTAGTLTLMYCTIQIYGHSEFIAQKSADALRIPGAFGIVVVTGFYGFLLVGSSAAFGCALKKYLSPARAYKF